MVERSKMQAAEMRFLQTIKGVTMFDKHRDTAIHESLDIKSVLHRIERSQLRWFGHASRIPHERLPKRTLFVEVSLKRPVGRPRTRWLDYIENLGWNRLGLYPSEMQSVLVDREMPPHLKIKEAEEEVVAEYRIVDFAEPCY